jgi:predicted nucleic acid-binding protein
MSSRASVRELFARHGVDPSELVEVIADALAASERVVPRGKAPDCRDENDRRYLHCVVSGNVPWLITRDRHLLDINAVGQTTILGPEKFLHSVGEMGIILID